MKHVRLVLALTVYTALSFLPIFYPTLTVTYFTTRGLVRVDALHAYHVFFAAALASGFAALILYASPRLRPLTIPSILAWFILYYRGFREIIRPLPGEVDDLFAVYEPSIHLLLSVAALPLSLVLLVLLEHWRRILSRGTRVLVRLYR